MTLTAIILVALFPVNVVLMYYFTSKIIDQIKDSALLARGRVVYEDEQVGTLTVYEDDAILELLDGTVVVIPRMVESHVDPNR